MRNKIHIPHAGRRNILRVLALYCIGVVIWSGMYIRQSYGQQSEPSAFDVPHIISYQGIVNDRNGSPLSDGNYQIIASFYGDENGSSKIWQGKYTVAVSNGVFNVMLGSGNSPLPSTKSLNKPIWVGIQIDGSSEMRPLSQLSASPYTLNIPDNSVTKSKMGTDYISKIVINGQEVKGKGAELNIMNGDGIMFDYNEAQNTLLVRGDISGYRSGGVHPAWIGFNGCAPFNVDGAPGVLTNTIGGGSGNNANPPAAIGAGCGAGFASIIGGQNNTANGLWSTVCGGNANLIGPGPGPTDYSFIGGGNGNNINAAALGGPSIAATICGGQGNNINPGGGPADFAFIGGGQGNNIAGGPGPSIGAMIGGGMNNTINAVGPGPSMASTICGGMGNNIASGPGPSDWCFIGGGMGNNIIGGPGPTMGSLIVGGVANNINGGGPGPAMATVICGGMGNIMNAGFAPVDFSFIGGGNGNTMNSPFSAIVGGTGNVINGPAPFSFIGGGNINTINGGTSVISGGNQNTTNGMFSTITGGTGALTTDWGQSAHASGIFGVQGDAQTSVFTLRNQTAAGAIPPLSLFLDGVANRITVPANGAMTLHVLLVGKSPGCAVAFAGWEILVTAIDNCGATLVNPIVVTPIGPTPAGWAVAVVPGLPNPASFQSTVDIQVTGGGFGTAIDWVASVRTAEVVF